MRHPAPLLRTLACLLLGGWSTAPAETLVVVRSTASNDYLQQRAPDGKRRTQSYVFMTGRFFPGITHDNSLEKTSFRTIAERLAMDLRRQDFQPAPSLAKADLVLVVHWGVTMGNGRDSVALTMSMENMANISFETEHARQDLADALARDDLTAAGIARDNLASLANASKSERQNMITTQDSGGENSATLLGLGTELQNDDENPFGSERRKALVGMTQEERYFVIVAAYDAPTLVSAKRMKRLWTLRASIRSAGVNFYQALDRIGNIAGDYFGTKQDGVTLAHTGDRHRQESVTLGELVLLGTVEP